VRSAAALAVTVVLWASAFAGIRVAVAAYGPGHLALLRFLAASAALAGYAALARPRLPRAADLPGVAAAGLAGVAVYHVALNAGERTVTAGAASLLVGTVPLLTALLAAAWLGERPGPRVVAGLALGLAGAALVAAGEGGAAGPAGGAPGGALLVLLAALAQSAYFVLQKPYLARYGAAGVTACAVWVGTAALLVFLPGLPAAVRAAPPAATAAALYLGLFPGALAYATWAYALARMPAARAAGALYLVPPTTVLIAALWPGESPSPLALAGGAVALAGVAVATRRPARRPTARGR
jgi:drug/metabolite transporter (DMT)-like permease